MYAKAVAALLLQLSAPVNCLTATTTTRYVLLATSNYYYYTTSYCF